MKAYIDGLINHEIPYFWGIVKASKGTADQAVTKGVLKTLEAIVKIRTAKTMSELDIRTLEKLVVAYEQYLENRINSAV